MTCDICQMKPAIRGAIVQGKFYANACTGCIGGDRPQVSADYKRENAREDNRKDLIQPFNRDGSANPDFAHAYPDIARNTFSKDELEEII